LRRIQARTASSSGMSSGCAGRPSGRA
jgi:hypothetical protein